MMNWTSLLLIVSTLFCNMSCPTLSTVPQVDLQRYSGKWYEIASFPQRFQKGCTCTSAEYTPTEKGYVIVNNQCRKDSAGGKTVGIKGKAFPVKGSNNAKLKVQFFWPFRGDYWIIDLADDYSYAVVGTENRNYLWILCRQPKMEQQTIEKILAGIKDKGFDTHRLSYTKQDCE